MKILLILILLTSACGSSGSSDIPIPITPTPTPTDITDNDDFVDLRNPRCSSIENITNGTVWKPISDSDGKPVFIIRSQFKKTFDICKVKTKAGGYQPLTFKGFANGNRQHWRASNNCDKYAGIRAGGEIVCNEPSQECKFKLSAGPCKRQD